MKMAKKLKNPFVLGAQGFLLGGAIFWATHAGDTQDVSSSATVAAATATVSSR